MGWQPTEAIIAAALAHAERDQPKEACGLVHRGEYRPVTNVATGVDVFTMDPREVANLSRTGSISAVVHSHVYLPPIASEADRAGCERFKLPWLIVSWPTRKWTVIEPCGWRAPLVGRQWAWGSQDCWGLVRDAYEDFAGLELKDYPRVWEWWNAGENHIVERFEDAGFVRLPPDSKWQHLDIAGMQIRSKVVNHLGIYLQPGILLHQMAGRLSVRQTFGGIYKTSTVLHLRHRNFLQAPPAEASDSDGGVAGFQGPGGAAVSRGEP